MPGGDLRTALAAIGQAKGVVELQAKLTGETEKRQEGREQPQSMSLEALQVLVQNTIALPKTGAGVPTKEQTEAFSQRYLRNLPVDS